MVLPEASAKFGLPLALFTYEPALTTQLNQSLYQLTVTGSQPTATGLVLAPTSITFHYAANGVDAVKTFNFDSTYVIGVQTTVKQNGSPVRALVEWPAGLGDMEEFKQSGMLSTQTRTLSYFAWSLDGKESSLVAAKVSGNNTQNQPYQYAAVMDQYFASAFLPDMPGTTSVVTLHNTIDLPTDLSDPNSKKTPADVLGLAVGDTSGITSLRLFCGPKGTDLLKSIHAIGAGGANPTVHHLNRSSSSASGPLSPNRLYIILRFMVGRHGISNWAGPSSCSRLSLRWCCCPRAS